VKAKAGPRSLWRMAVKLAELQQAAGKRRDALLTATHALRHAMRAHTAVGGGRTHPLPANPHVTLRVAHLPARLAPAFFGFAKRASAGVTSRTAAG